MTVYKAIKKEADAASDLAVALAKGEEAGADKLATGSVEDTETGEQVKSVLLEPQGITPGERQGRRGRRLRARGGRLHHGRPPEGVPGAGSRVMR